MTLTNQFHQDWNKYYSSSEGKKLRLSFSLFMKIFDSIQLAEEYIIYILTIWFLISFSLYGVFNASVENCPLSFMKVRGCLVIILSCSMWSSLFFMRDMPSHKNALSYWQLVKNHPCCSGYTAINILETLNANCLTTGAMKHAVARFLQIYVQFTPIPSCDAKRIMCYLEDWAVCR